MCPVYPRWNVLWGETFFLGQQNPFLLKYTQNWSVSAHTGVVPVTGVQYEIILKRAGKKKTENLKLTD